MPHLAQVVLLLPDGPAHQGAHYYLIGRRAAREIATSRRLTSVDRTHDVEPRLVHRCLAERKLATSVSLLGVAVALVRGFLRAQNNAAGISFQLTIDGLRVAALRKEGKWFQNGSMNITVKNVPDSIYRVMKREAKKKRRSLNAEIIHALETEAAEAERRRGLSSLRKQLDRFASSLPPLSDSATLIRADRDR